MKITPRIIKRILEQEKIEFDEINRAKRKAHYLIKLSNGRIVVVSSTPSDGRALANFKADLRREARI